MANSVQNAFQYFENVEACPVCGNAEFIQAFEADVSRCGKCLTYFRSPRPTQTDIQRSYDYGANYAQWKESDPKARRAMWDRRLQLIRQFKPSGDLLDVGAGDGYFMGVAAESGYTTSGTELSATGIEIARRKGQVIRQGQLTSIEFDGRKFDVVTIWHVLEHVPNPGEVIATAHKLLKPEGILAIAVPNEENSLFRHRLGLRRAVNPLGSLTWGQEIHLTHFQPETLRAALKRADFEILKFGVDDIYADRSWRNLAKLTMQKTLSALIGWHFSMAMYCVSRAR